jgi:hypothetical protein
VQNVTHHNVIGVIKWSGGWRRYVFFPEGETYYDHECLFEIGQELQRMTEAHKAKGRV